MLPRLYVAGLYGIPLKFAAQPYAIATALKSVRPLDAAAEEVLAPPAGLRGAFLDKIIAGQSAGISDGADVKKCTELRRALQSASY